MALLRRGKFLEIEVTYNKGMFMYPSGVIAEKSLLVADGLYHGSVLHLLEHVDV